MIKIKFRTSIAPLFTLALLSACATGFATGNHPAMTQHEGMRSQTIEFSKGKLIEVVYFTVKEGKQKQLNEQYIPKASAISKEYGAKMLGFFAVEKKAGGEIDPKTIAMFEWPSFAAKARFEKDARFQAVLPIREEALQFIKFGYYEVSENVSVTFLENKTYEFFGAWLNPNGKEKLQKYFKVSTPIKQNYGRPAPIFKAMLAVVKDSPTADYVYKPHMAGIVEWDQSDDYFTLIKNQAFKEKAAPLMANAIARIDMLHAKMIFKN